MSERYPYSAPPESADLIKYLWRFIAAYLVLAIIIGVITALFELQSVSALSALVILVAAQFAGHFFFKDHNRLPTKPEKKRFALYGAGFSLLIAVLPFGFLIAMQEQETTAIVETLGFIGLGAALLVSAVLAYFLSSFGFGQGAKFGARAVEAQKKRDIK